MPKQTIKLVSWNVNGYRAIMKKDFLTSIGSLDADIVGLQETKLQEAQLTPAMKEIDGYQAAFSFSTVKKGTAVWLPIHAWHPRRCAMVSTFPDSTMKVASWNWSSMRLLSSTSISPTVR